MVDRIVPIKPPDRFRVDEAKESLDDEDKRKGAEEEEEGEPDAFDKNKDGTDWHIRLERPVAGLDRLVLPRGEIAEMKFIRVHLKTKPSLVEVSLLTRDGVLRPKAFVAVPRPLALARQAQRPGAPLSPEEISREETLTFLIPGTVSVRPDVAAERTLSQTVKIILRRTWMQRLGLEDPDTKLTNREIATAYATVIVVAGSIAFALWWIMR